MKYLTCILTLIVGVALAVPPIPDGSPVSETIVIQNGQIKPDNGKTAIEGLVDNKVVVATNAVGVAAKQYTDGKVIEGKAYTDTATNAVGVAAKQYTDSQLIVATNAVVGAANQYTDGKVVEAKTYTDAATNAAGIAANNYSDGKLVEAKQYSDGKLNEAKNYTDTETGNAVVAAKGYTDTATNAVLSAANIYSDGKLVEAKGYTDNATNTVLHTAGSYTDGKLVEAKQYADTEVGNSLVASKGYTDTATNVVGGAISTHINNLQNPHNVTAAQIGALTTEADPEALPRIAAVEGRTNNWNTAYTHSQTNHKVTDEGGFQGGGSGAFATTGGAVGVEAMTTTGGAVGAGANAYSGGAVGYEAHAETGGAVGDKAETQGGGAVGFSAYAGTGGAVGYGAYADTGGAVGHGAGASRGGAVGEGANASSGGAVGSGATTGDGFAGGKEAFTLDAQWDPIDAVQLGTGNNPSPGTLQVYNHQLLDASGNIPYARVEQAFNQREPVIDIPVVNGTATVHMVESIIPEYHIDSDSDFAVVAVPIIPNSVRSQDARLLIKGYAGKTVTFSAEYGNIWKNTNSYSTNSVNEFVMHQKWLGTNVVSFLDTIGEE